MMRRMLAENISCVVASGGSCRAKHMHCHRWALTALKVLTPSPPDMRLRVESWSLARVKDTTSLTTGTGCRGSFIYGLKIEIESGRTTGGSRADKRERSWQGRLTIARSPSLEKADHVLKKCNTTDPSIAALLIADPKTTPPHFKNVTYIHIWINLLHILIIDLVVISTRC